MEHVSRCPLTGWLQKKGKEPWSVNRVLEIENSKEETIHLDSLIHQTVRFYRSRCQSSVSPDRWKVVYANTWKIVLLCCRKHVSGIHVNVGQQKHPFISFTKFCNNGTWQRAACWMRRKAFCSIIVMHSNKLLSYPSPHFVVPAIFLTENCRVVYWTQSMIKGHAKIWRSLFYSIRKFMAAISL